MTSKAAYYERLAMGAEYLAATASNREERAEHLKMAGSYHRQARLEGSPSRPAVIH